MVDFNELYSRPAGKAPPPALLPSEWYPFIISAQPEPVETNIPNPKNPKEKLPAIRIPIKLMGWPDSILPEKRKVLNEEGEAFDIDLSSIRLSRDFTTPLDDPQSPSWYYLDQFLRSGGFNLKESTYGDIFPQLLGRRGQAQLQQYMGNDNILRNRVGQIKLDKY